MVAKNTIIAGSIKNGFMHIKSGETVEVVKITEKSVFVKKNEIVKSFSKKLFN